MNIRRRRKTLVSGIFRQDVERVYADGSDMGDSFLEFAKQFNQEPERLISYYEAEANRILKVEKDTLRACDAKQVIDNLKAVKNNLNGDPRFAAYFMAFAAQAAMRAQIRPYEKFFRSGAASSDGASRGGRASAKWSSQKDELQAAVDSVYRKHPDWSYESIKKQVVKDYGSPKGLLAALKRYTKNPAKS